MSLRETDLIRTPQFHRRPTGCANTLTTVCLRGGALRLDYRLEGAGWATAEIAIADQRVEMVASICTTHFVTSPRLRALSPTVRMRRPSSSGTNPASTMCSCGAAHVRGHVLAVLRALLDRHGAAGYRQLWGEYDFPFAEYEALRAAR